MKNSSIVMSIAAMLAAGAPAAAVTLAPPDGATTNVLQIYTGDTAVEIAGPGTVSLSAANSHTGGTTLSGGTLALSGDVPASGRSQIGAGALTITGGTLRGSGTVARGIAATAATTLAGDPALALAGNNDFQAGAAFAEGTVEISGGETAFGGRIDLGNQAGETATLRVSGGTVTSAGNLQRGYVANANSTLIMTGGTFDVGGKNSVVGYNGGPVVARTDISGTASLRKIGNFYIHADGGASSVNEISVHDGGTLGFAALYDNASASTTLSVDGGTLANDSSGASAFNWIRETVSSFSVGNGGVTFSGTPESTVVAQIRKAMQAASGSSGTAAGVTFDGGAWGYYVAGNAYNGPTTLKNQSKLFLYANGAIPSGSVVTIKAGSILSNGGAAKTVSSLVLEDDAILGFGSSANALIVSGSIELPSRAKIALYNSDNPSTTAKNDNGSYAVLKVPASYADALCAVSWTCATATSGKSYTFSVTTSGDIATLSMTIATAPSDTFAVSGDTALGGTLNVSGDITIGSGATLAASPIYGSATGGSININNGGTLDASGGNIRPVDKSGNSFHLYLNEGGTLVVNQIHGSDNDTIKAEATATGMFHFNGGTIYPVAFEAVDGNRFLLNYQTAVVGANGVTVDLNRWIRPDGYTTWTRCSIQGNFNHDSNCTGSDGGITVRGIKGEERSVVLFGSRFGGSDIDGGIHVEDGATVAVHANALVGQTIELAPGSRFRPYDNNTVNIGNLTIGANGASEAVRLDLPTSSVSAPGVAVSGTLSVLSPVEVAFTGSWNNDSTVSAGVYTALVYKAASSALDTSLFRTPPGFSISSETVAINTGDYNGYTALVLTLAQDDLSLDDSAEKTIAADAAYGNIYVGDSGTAANKSLLVNGGTITAGTLHLAHTPVDGANSSEKHVATYVQSGGEVSVNTLYSMYRGFDSQAGRVSAEITLNGGSLAVSGDAQLGFNQTRSGYSTTVTVNNGAEMTVGGDMQLTHYGKTQSAPQGILVMNGGSLAVGKDIDLSCCTNRSNYQVDGGIFLHGGTLSARNIKQTVDYTPAQRLFFNGGTFAPNAAAAGRTLSGLTAAHVSTNGAVISTANLPSGAAYTIAQALETDPALDGAPDGGLVKKGAGTLALSGANTYAGRTVVEAGTLAVANADAISDSVTVANGAAIEASGLDLSLASVTASGTVAARSLTVSGAIELPADGSVLSVDGDLTLARGVAIDFSAYGEVPSGYVPVAVASGTVTIPDLVRARGAGDNTRCETKVEGGVLYAKPTSAGFMMIVR
ncbi:MAG: autotransporter-associated beta strand repeat-containing protein [Kiritimatiellae bacterium]|nr:autotransporter-associated beta strand repeat-containing protein [Kiritimatiellia bacterium]